MKSIVSRIDINKTSDGKLSKSEQNILADQARKEIDRQKMIATAAYRAEKRGFKGTDTDVLKDWHEAEMEIGNGLDVFGVNILKLDS